MTDFGSPPSPHPPHTTWYRVTVRAAEECYPQDPVGGCQVYIRDSLGKVDGPYLTLPNGYCYINIYDHAPDYWDIAMIGCSDHDAAYKMNFWLGNGDDVDMGKGIVCDGCPTLLYEESPGPNWP